MDKKVRLRAAAIGLDLGLRKVMPTVPDQLVLKNARNPLVRTRSPVKSGDVKVKNL